MGRPSLYTPELAAEICRLLAEGLSLREMCRRDEMPARSTVVKWAIENAGPGFSDQYACARDIGYEHMADELVEIADDGTNDWMTRQGDDGDNGVVLNHEHVQRSRLRVDSRKWLLSKMLPKKYGDKLTQELTGANGNPLLDGITVTFVRAGEGK